MRTDEESFHIIFCFLESPSTYPNPVNNNIFNIPASSSSSYSLAVELFKMTPTNLGGNSCESYTEKMTFSTMPSTFSEG